MTPTSITHLRELLAKATSGPWQVSGARDRFYMSPSAHATEAHAVGPDGDAVAFVMFDPILGIGFADAHLIVALVNAAPRLLDMAEENARLREELSEAVDLLNGVEVFVKSREQIKKPEGHEWFDKRLARARAALKETSDEG